MEEDHDEQSIPERVLSSASSLPKVQVPSVLLHSSVPLSLLPLKNLAMVALEFSIRLLLELDFLPQYGSPTLLLPLPLPLLLLLLSPSLLELSQLRNGSVAVSCRGELFRIDLERESSF